VVGEIAGSGAARKTRNRTLAPPHGGAFFPSRSEHPRDTDRHRHRAAIRFDYLTPDAPSPRRAPRGCHLQQSWA
jgi:hypothetical protein